MVKVALVVMNHSHMKVILDLDQLTAKARLEIIKQGSIILLDVLAKIRWIMILRGNM